MKLKEKSMLACIFIGIILVFSGCNVAKKEDVSTEENISSSENVSAAESSSSSENGLTEKSEHPSGTVITIPDFYSPQLDTNNNVLRIYLPYGYEASTESYPVIYMPDGQNLFSSSTATYGKAWGISTLLDKMQMEEKTKGIIVVGIDAPSDRTKAYNLYMDSYQKKSRGLANDTSDFYADTVKPYIDENYRTLQDREHTAILGASYGAIISFNTTLRHPELFGNVGMFSYCDNQAPKRMTDFLKKNMTDKALKKPFVYFFTGNYDFARESAILSYQIALENGMEHICLEEDKIGQHDEYTWSHYFENCVSFWGWLDNKQ